MTAQQNKDRSGEHFLYPSTLFVSPVPSFIKTILGSCVAVCLYDTVLTTGGMNHFMLPLWNGHGFQSPKYGNIAIDMLLEKMLQLGSRKENLVAKVFGGASYYLHQSGKQSVGDRNSLIAQYTLNKYRIPVTACSVGGNRGRKVVFNTFNGQVLMKYIIQNSNQLRAVG